ncbi:LysR family transcriptional regulator [Tropicibacter sp. R16_0]|uniref:LysR family transcriptional regulator n=1 Tax=Tropicibacter sp. R16_0 TaxID=2821102 RepID=UPI001ADA4D8E|nr:LysR family transcriptional regulator [Tropicibacter sp. R16_0]MBO9453050.1 LysR family transcriptional regulator [Tropicibacter sp. R16_0]
MDWKTVSFDWNQIRAFLATAEEGSFSAAARALGLTQPTLGRQIAALEVQLGVLLFDRGGRFPVLTPSGLELLEHAQSMLQAAGQLTLAASGQSQAVEGEVSVTANELMTAYVLPSVVGKLRALAPGIRIRLAAADDLRDLTKREADIAVRHVRPEQSDLIARLVGKTRAHLYASSTYLDELGRPDLMRDPARIELISDESQDRTMRGLKSKGLQLEQANFKVVSNSRVAVWEMVKQGMGIAMMTDDIAANTPNIERVCADQVSFEIPVWLATHRELRSSRRIRLVFDELVEHFTSSRRYRG